MEDIKRGNNLLAWWQVLPYFSKVRRKGTCQDRLAFENLFRIGSPQRMWIIYHAVQQDLEHELGLRRDAKGKFGANHRDSIETRHSCLLLTFKTVSGSSQPRLYAHVPQRNKEKVSGVKN